jgi:predicted nucleotide-binding protein
MPANDELVQLMNTAAQQKSVAPDIDLEDSTAVFEQMNQLLGRALLALLTQNVQEAELAARAALGLYAAVKKLFHDDDLRPLLVVANTVTLYVPLTRTLLFHGEARYSAALSEIEKTRAIARDTLAVVTEYGQSPDAEPEVQQIFEPMLIAMQILHDAQDVMIRGEMAAYHGDVGTCVALLREGVSTARARIDSMPPSNHQVVHQLMAMCSGVTDRMYTRAENLSNTPIKRYLEPIGDKVFIVHGHDEAKWRELRDLLEDRFQLEPIVLKEEAGGGKTLIAKFEEHADQCRYAFVLITPDDFVKKGKKTYFQARPNVLFELGWFCGHFGRDRVSIVKKADTDLPSDLNGLITIDFQGDIAEAVIQIERELKKVGITKPKKRARKPKAGPAHSLG